MNGTPPEDCLTSTRTGWTEFPYFDRLSELKEAVVTGVLCGSKGIPRALYLDPEVPRIEGLGDGTVHTVGLGAGAGGKYEQVGETSREAPPVFGQISKDSHKD